ncbi:MAG: ABC transporter permease subunit [Luteimonas sp.]
MSAESTPLVAPAGPLGSSRMRRRVPAGFWFVSVGLVLSLLPLLRLPAFYESFLYLIFVWVALAASWNILSGYSGYFSFGHGAFFGAGMYTTATFAGKLEVPFLWALPLCALVAGTFGLAIGAIVFRVRGIRGELFSLLTLAVSVVLATIVLNTPIDGGPGVYLSAVPVPSLYAAPASTFYVLGLALALGTLWIAYRIFHSKLGTGLFAIHDDEDAAEVMGVPTYRYKLVALGLSSALAGVAGGIHSMFVSYITVGETFSITVPLYVVLMSVLGGTRHWFGPAIGAAIVTALLYSFTAGDYAVFGRGAIGAILIAVILFMPEGVIGQLLRLRNKKQPSADAPSAAPAVESRVVAPPARASTAKAGEPLIRLLGVTKAFSGVRALDDVSFDIRRGEILGLVGPNGSGKSTTINVISGHYQTTAGEIRFGDLDLAGMPAHRIARVGIARTYQIPRPFVHLSVLDNVALAAMFGQASLAREDAERQARHWLEFTSLAERARALPADLNLHQRKFLELARALAARPSVLFLDEVLSGLTPTEIDGAISLIKSIREQGTTIVFVEHVIRAVMALTDRVVVLNHGKVIAQGNPAEVMALPQVVTAYLGKPHV